MAYNPLIPAGTDQFSQSQSDIQGNFAALNPIFNGINNFILLPIQSSGPTTSSSQVAVYSKNNSNSGLQELYFRQVSNGVEVPCTAANPDTNGWTYLPSGLVLKWGTVSISPLNSVQTVMFPGSPAPVFNNIFNFQVSTGVSSSTDYNQTTMIASFNTTQFQVYARQLLGVPPTSVTAYYFAIGN